MENVLMQIGFCFINLFSKLIISLSLSTWNLLGLLYWDLFFKVRCLYDTQALKAFFPDAMKWGTKLRSQCS